MAIDDKEIEYNNGWVTEETQEQELQIGQHIEEISLDITNIGQHDIILGRPWLKKHNPLIDWETEDLDFGRCLCEHEPKWKQSIKVITKKQIKAIARKGKQTIQQLQYWEEKDNPQIPEQYQKFGKVFQKAEDIGLPEHKP